MNPHRLGLAIAWAAVLLGAAGTARADAAVLQAQQLLHSDNHEEVEAGIQSLGLIGTVAAVDPLVARIREGLPADLLETALFTLMALGQPSAGPVLYELSTHRRSEIRLRAVEAIAAVNPPGAEAALITALSDSHPKVRSAAAAALGEVHAAGALEMLFHALDRGNLEASPAIGKVMQSDQVGRLLEYLGKIPFRSLGPALAAVLQRSDVNERAKLDIVARLQEVATPEVKGFMGDVVASGAEALGPRVSKALLNAMQQIAD